MRIYIRIYCSIAIVIGLLVPARLAANPALPEVVLEGNAVVRLQNLPWEFYWKALIFPTSRKEVERQPDLIVQPVTIWNEFSLPSFGYATYRTKFRLKASGERLAIHMPTPLTSYRVFVNGEKLAEVGVVATDARGFRPQRKSALLFFTASGEEVEIIVQVANFILYKGGMRGSIELGNARSMQAYGMRYLAVDLFSIGLIFAIMLYHFLIFVLMRKDISTLIFAILALDYFLLAFLFGEQSISLFLPDLPTHIHNRLGSFLAYVLPPLVLEFTSRLGPGTIHRKILTTYWIIATVFSLLLILPPFYSSAYNVYYHAVTGFTAGGICLWSAWQGILQNRPGARLLLAGLLFLVALTAYSVYLFATHSVAGSFLSIGFSLFALFQSGSLAHNHAALERQNMEMHLRLERSREALENQRRQIEANLHDSLGGNLTDIQLGLEALGQKSGAKSIRADLRRLDHRVAGTIGSLRTELLYLEDLQLAMKDFVSGINLILLRRYQMARRKIDIQISNETRDNGRWLEEHGVIDEEVKLELCMIVQELCNNNLKHGTGSARWQIAAEKNLLSIELASHTRGELKSTGLGHGTLRERVEKIRGRFEESLSGKNYSGRLILEW